MFSSKIVRVLYRPAARPFKRIHRNYSSAGKGRGLVLGAYDPQEEGGPLILTPTANKFDQSQNGQLQKILTVASRKLKPGNSRVLYGLGGDYTTVAVANLGKQDAGFCPLNQFDEGRENVRSAVASACRQLQNAGETQVEVDPCGDAEAAAEGSFLSLYSYDELKAEDKRKDPVKVTCNTSFLPFDGSEYQTKWERGTLLGKGQNLARHLMEAPSNKMTPSIFCKEVTKQLAPNCSLIVRDRKWAESEKMGAFLAVAQGSIEPPKFLEIHYQGASSSMPPVALVGKGITFDAGGISLKPSADMDKMRADMGGAACVAGAIMTASRLKLPINIRGFIALCENMPSGHAMKPGDVITARNGKTIQVDNTDAEGRLILADTLCYAETFQPSLMLDIATLTGAIDVALGAGAAAAYTNCDVAWDHLQQAGSRTGDRLWRMPLFELYKNHVTTCQLADVNNVGKFPRSAGSCTAAAFLKEFVTVKHWVHLDIAGVMMNRDEVSYLNRGMSGRPTRTIVEFLQRLGKSSA
ncbi:cytosol aminopeptidase-like [Babylonia areolata]|uniref:cytosol aminopeptidase-like n=1 Tax=Babylonia areolata TaxID=304850 RepID=UPI003FD404D4